jgi:hypothetical protein
MLPCATNIATARRAGSPAGVRSSGGWGSSLPGRALITLANAYGFEGRADEALRALGKARGLLDGEREPRLAWLVIHNSVMILVEAERFAEAEALLREDLAAAARLELTPLDRLRLHWIEARVALGRETPRGRGRPAPGGRASSSVLRAEA